MGYKEPATVASVKAPLNGRVCARACLGSYDPALVPEAPIGLITKDSTLKTPVLVCGESSVLYTVHPIDLQQCRLHWYVPDYFHLDIDD